MSKAGIFHLKNWFLSTKKVDFCWKVAKKIHLRQEWSNLHSNFTEKRLFWPKEPPQVTVPFFKGARLGKPWLKRRFFWSAHTLPKGHKTIRKKHTYEPIELKFAEPQGGAPKSVCLKEEQKFPVGKMGKSTFSKLRILRQNWDDRIERVRWFQKKPTFELIWFITVGVVIFCILPL